MMRAVFRKENTRNSTLTLAMLDIISNAMAGIAVLFFLHVALQLQTPPPTPVRGRAVFEIELQVEPGASVPTAFLSYFNSKREQDRFLLFGAEIDEQETTFDFTEDPAAQIGFDRIITQDAGNPLKWTIHLLDPLEGSYSVGLIYVDHERFYEGRTPATIRIQSYFEFGEGDEVYRSKTLTREVGSPSGFHRFEVMITTTGLELI